MFNVIKKYRFSIGIVTIFCLMTSAYFAYSSQVFLTRDNLWNKDQIEASRNIASTMGEIDPRILIDIFASSSFYKYLKYNIDKKVITKSQKEKEVLTKLFNSTFNTVIENNNNEMAPDYFKGILNISSQNNLLLIFIKEFSDKLKEKKIKESFQIDINFTPEMSQEITFNDEYKDSQMINYGEVGNLSKKLNKQVPLSVSITNPDIPVYPEPYQYIGAVISLVFNKNNLPQIKYRRFFRVNRKKNLDYKLKTNNFNVNVTHFKSTQDNKTFIITSDLTKAIDLKGQTIRPLFKELYFGKVINSNKISVNPYISIQDSETTGILKFKGEIQFNGEFIEYESKLSYLSYDLQKKKIDERSMLVTKIKNKEHINNSDLKLSIYKELLNKHYYELAKQLNLTRFHKDMGLLNE